MTEVRGDEFQNGNCWLHTRQFSYEWQIQGLQDTENERVRKRRTEKKLQAHTLQHKAEIVYEWPAPAGKQRKDLGEAYEGEWTQSEVPSE